jgi:hypothetical protein
MSILSHLHPLFSAEHCQSYIGEMGALLASCGLWHGGSSAIRQRWQALTCVGAGRGGSEGVP